MAYRLSRTTRHLLVGLHVLISMAWFGGTISLLLLMFALNDAENAGDGEQLFYILSNMHVIDDTLIKFPGLAVLISGVILSLWTPWGLLEHYWIVTKLVLTTAIIFIGIFFISDWFSFAVETVDQFGHAALLRNESLLATQLFLIRIAVFNIAAIAIMTFISFSKPFGKLRG